MSNAKKTTKEVELVSVWYLLLNAGLKSVLKVAKLVDVVAVLAKTLRSRGALSFTTKHPKTNFYSPPASRRAAEVEAEAGLPKNMNSR